MNVGIGKSKIQLIKEENEKVANLRDAIINFFENWDTKSMVFGIINNRPCELEEGYLEVEHECEDLNEALYSLNDSRMALHALDKDGKKIYRIGHVYGKMDECKCDQIAIVNIKNLQDIA